MVLTERYYVFGDVAYPLRRNLLAPYSGAQLTQEEMSFNSSMSKVRVTVEWMFGEVINNLIFTDFKKNLKIGISCVGKFYRVSAILTNAHTCLYKNNVSQYFAIDPPLLEEYFQLTKLRALSTQLTLFTCNNFNCLEN